MNNILLVEDDEEITKYLIDFLRSEGFSVKRAKGQTDGLEMFSNNGFDCVLLDLNLGDGNGFSVCSAIKSRSQTPVIFLTASGDENCTVAGFEIGADDYISKPFRPKELAARIKNVIRRSGGNSFVGYRDIKIDTSKGIVTKSGKEVFLTALEYKLLLIFLTNRGQLLSRDKLFEELWAAAGEYVTDNTLTVYIKRLREKIEDDPKSPQIVKTVRGLGYKAGD